MENENCNLWLVGACLIYCYYICSCFLVLAFCLHFSLFTFKCALLWLTIFLALKNFMQSQGKRVRLRQEFRQSLQDIFLELRRPSNEKATNSKSAVSADLVTLGDSWLNIVIKEGLIEPMKGVEEEVWFRNLSDKWKVGLMFFFFFFPLSLLWVGFIWHFCGKRA